MTLDEVCGDSEIEWMDVPQLNPETLVSCDYRNAFYEVALRAKNEKFGGVPAAIEWLKQNKIPTYQEYFRQLEERYSKNFGKNIKFRHVVHDKNEGMAELLNSIVERINSLPAEYAKDASRAGKNLVFLLDLAEKTIQGDVPRYR